MKKFMLGALTATLCMSLLDAPASGQSSDGYKRVGETLSKRLEDAANAGTNQAAERRQEPPPPKRRRRAKRSRRRG